MNFFSITIFIISYNRLDDLRKCISFLEKDGYTNLNIIDNASTDIELISYLKKLKHNVYFLEKNWGPYVLWESHLFDSIVENEYYVVTDPDIIPIEQCPSDYIEYFYSILQNYPEKTKAGFSLKLDDIPDSYPYKYDVWRGESFYWERRLDSIKSSSINGGII